MLLARRQREHEAAPAVAVDSLADESSRQAAHEFFLRSEKAVARSAEGHRHAETLPFADGDVGPPGARRLEQRERKRLGRYRREQRTAAVACRPDGREIFDDAEEVWISDDGADRLIVERAREK